MKNNKLKAFSIIIVLTFCLSILLACTPPVVHLNSEELKNEVVSIELLNYNGERKKVKTIEAIAPFDINKAEKIETLTEVDVEFFDEMSEIDFWDNKLVISSVGYSYEPVDYSIKLNYTNGDFCVVFYARHQKENETTGSMIKYNSENVCIDAFGYMFRSENEKFFDIIEKYFNISVDE